MRKIDALKSTKESIIGCLLGTAVGDSLGLCYEGLSKRRQRKMFSQIDKHRFFFNKGMISDDTEHTIIISRAIIKSGGSLSRFLRNISWSFRFWLMGLPAGTGMATLKSCLKLCVGFSGENSGVFSAGNGPEMRSAIIGVIYGHDPDKMKEFVRASTRITHTDPKAEYGALAVALAAYMASCKNNSSSKYYENLRNLLNGEGEEFLKLVKKAKDLAPSGKTIEFFAETLGLEKGISGYIYHTVPVVLYGWFKNPEDYKESILEIIRCGGDTDSTAAILGAITGAGVGEKGIPSEWIENLKEWPASVEWMRKLGEVMYDFSTDNKARPVPKLNFFFLLLRNIFFMFLVLSHGFRRLFPPY